MPEHKAKSGKKKDVNKAVSSNIHELAHGKHHADRVKKQGKEGAHKQEIAVAEKIARGKEKDKFAPSSGSSKKQSRNKGRR
jgi:hypothetical protein